MGYNTASTEWPSISPSSEIKALIDELFLVLDSDKDGAGEQLADKVFMHDGVLVGPKGKFEGTEEIRRCRDGAWTVVKKRRHLVGRVYMHDVEAHDLLLIGNVKMGLVNGKELDSEFTGRVVIAEDKAGEPKIKLYQVWADSAPLSEALKN